MPSRKFNSASRRVSATFALASAIIPVSAIAADGPFTINYSLPPASLDPTLVCDIADIGFVSDLYVTLLKHPSKPVATAPQGVTVTAEDTTKLEGYLAESWTVSDDGKVITFKIRDGVKFASGNPVDGPAVAASLNRGLKSGNCGTYFIEAGQFGNTVSIEAPDAKTVVITLKAPEPLLLQALAVPSTSIVDVKAIDAAGDPKWLSTHAAGSGPYVLKSYEPGVKAEFAANPDFFGAAPLEKDVVINFIPDNSTLLLQARNGKADVTLGLSKAATASLKDDAKLAVIEVPTSRWQLLSLPNKLKPFDNVKFREALSYAVPYKAILDTVAHGYGQLYYGPFPPAFGAYNPAIGAERPYDLENAKALLGESGVTGPVALDVLIKEGQNDQEQIATIIQGAWAPLGVTVTIKKLPASAYAEAVGAETKQAAIVRFDGPSVADPAWLLDYDLKAASTFNTSNYANAEAEALLLKAHPIADPAARQAIWDEVAKLWVADAPRIPVYADTYTAVVSKSVKAWSFEQNGPFDVANWSR
jgi:peptide/nickel transport system substrate-binding protein